MDVLKFTSKFSGTVQGVFAKGGYPDIGTRALGNVYPIVVITFVYFDRETVMLIHMIRKELQPQEVIISKSGNPVDIMCI